MHDLSRSSLAPGPAGGLLSTLDDLAKLMRFQLGGGPDTVITRDTLQASYQMVVPSDADLRYGDGVGFAAVRNADSQLTALGHGGLLNGFAASYEFDLATHTGIILLTHKLRTCRLQEADPKDSRVASPCKQWWQRRASKGD